MDRTEKIAKLKVLLGDIPDTDDVLDVYFDLAENEILGRAYPYGIPDPIPATFWSKYDWLSIQIAQALYLRAGADGEIRHSENGIDRAYLTDGIPRSLLYQIVPYTGSIS